MESCCSFAFVVMVKIYTQERIPFQGEDGTSFQLN